MGWKKMTRTWVHYPVFWIIMLVSFRQTLQLDCWVMSSYFVLTRSDCDDLSFLLSKYLGNIKGGPIIQSSHEKSVANSVLHTFVLQPLCNSSSNRLKHRSNNGSVLFSIFQLSTVVCVFVNSLLNDHFIYALGL